MNRSVVRDPYFVLAVLLFALMASHVANGAWINDFWYYAASVRELAARPLAPHHPLLALDAPHHFLTPYVLGVALVARLLHSDPIRTLAAAGLFNLLLFVVTFRQFVIAVTGRPTAAFYGLLFTLLMWKPGLILTGFVKLDALGPVLPYASTFATAVMYGVYALALHEPQTPRRVGALTLVFAVLLVTHPPTGMTAIVGLMALAASSPRDPVRRISMTLIAIACAGLLALLWPYYPFYTLVTSFSHAYHMGNRNMYGLQPLRAFASGEIIDVRAMLHDFYPALLGLPLVLYRLRDRRRDPLALMFAGLLLVYAYGGITRQWSYGRVLPTLVAVLHIATADWLARLQATPARARSRFAIAYAGVIALVFVVGAVPMLKEAQAYLPGQHVRLAASADPFRFLSDYVGRDDVIVTCPTYGPIVAAVAGKVIAAGSQDILMAFVDDDAQRRTDLDILLRPRTPLVRRKQLLAKYHARFVLLMPPIFGDCISLGTAMQLGPLGDVVAENGQLRLIRLRDTDVNPGAAAPQSP